MSLLSSLPIQSLSIPQLNGLLWGMYQYNCHHFQEEKDLLPSLWYKVHLDRTCCYVQEWMLRESQQLFDNHQA